MIYHFLKVDGDNEAIFDFRDLSKVHLKNNNNVLAFDTKWDKVLTAVTNRPTESIFESLYKMQVGRNEILVAHLHSRHDIWRRDYCRLQLMVQRHIDRESKILNSKPEIDTRTDLKLELLAKVNKAKGKKRRQCQK